MSRCASSGQQACPSRSRSTLLAPADSTRGVHCAARPALLCVCKHAPALCSVSIAPDAPALSCSVTDTPWVRDRVVERQVTVLRAPIYHPSQLRTAFSPSWSIEPHPLEGAVEWVMAAESSTGEDASGAVGENRALHTDAARTAACEPLEATGEERRQPGKPDNGEAKADGGKELEALVYGGYTFHLPPMSLAAAAGHRACAPPPLTPVSASDAPHNKAVAEAQEAAGHEKATANLEQLPAMTDVPVPSLALYATALPAPAAPHTPDEAPGLLHRESERERESARARARARLRANTLTIPHNHSPSVARHSANRRRGGGGVRGNLQHFTAPQAAYAC